MSERFEPSFQAGNADRRGTHIHATARLSQIEWHADDANILLRSGRGLQPVTRALLVSGSVNLRFVGCVVHLRSVLRINLVQHAREWDRLTHVFQRAYPR